MPQAEAEKCHPAGLDFPDFPEPLKREFLQLLHYTKNGEFSEFLDTVKRGGVVRGLCHDWGHVQRTGKVEFLATVKRRISGIKRGI